MIDKEVGEGTFGKVYRAKDIQSNELLALKMIKPSACFERDGFPITSLREVKVLKFISSCPEEAKKYVVQLKEVMIYDETEEEEEDHMGSPSAFSDFDKGSIFLVFEYCHFDLAGLLRNRDISLSKAHILSFMKQLIDGMAFIHHRQLLHRDLKPENILITRRNEIKIADWGSARSVKSARDKE